MNKQIIPTGPTEVITNGTVTANILIIEAITDLVITNLVFINPKQPANAGVDAAFTLPAGGHLFYVESLTFTGTAQVVYTGN